MQLQLKLMTRLLLFITSSLVIIACSNETAIKQKQSEHIPENPVIELEVKLASDLDTISGLKLFFCGMIEVRQTFNFRVIRVLKGTYTENTIPINILCPLEQIKSKQLQHGVLYTFRLKRRKMCLTPKSEMCYTGDFEIVGSRD